MAASAELGVRVPRKAKNVLNNLVGSRAMSTEGMEWLICATDPFHDDKVRCPGYPDMSTVNSVVQTFTNTVSISAPAGQTAPWDLHVPFIPVSPPLGQFSGSSAGAPRMNGFLALESGLLQTALSPVNAVPLYPGYNAIVCATTGTDWLGAGSGAGVTNTSALAIPAKYSSGQFRLIGGGIEAVNTTADLYKGGSITGYRAPSNVGESTIASTPITVTTPMPEDTSSTSTTSSVQELEMEFDSKTGKVIKKQNSRKELKDSPVVGTSTIYPNYPITTVELPPTTQAEASLYTDSRTWAAEDGCYSIIAQADLENPFLITSPGEVLLQKVLDSTTVQENMVSGSPEVVYTTTWNGSNPGLSTSYLMSNFGGSCSKPLPFTNSGFIMAGLNAQSTIQLTQRLYFERIPATSEADLLSMAQVPPAHDPLALEIYSRCLAQMPVACPQNENPLGEWFNSVLDTIKGIAPRIGQFVSSLGGAISYFGNGVQDPPQSNATPQRKQTKAQKQQANKNFRSAKTIKGIKSGRHGAEGPPMRGGQFYRNAPKKKKKNGKKKK